MIIYNPQTDIMASPEVEFKPLSTDCLIQMMENCVWAERVYLELGLYDVASKYAKIWHRLFRACSNKMLKRS